MKRMIWGGIVMAFLAFGQMAQAMYDPVEGRWLSRDPLPDAIVSQGPNLYEYCLNNPVNYVDPLGLDVAVVVSGYVGAGYNFFGHAGAGVTGYGAYSFGTKEPFGSSFTDYVADRSALTYNTVYIIPATPEQDAAFVKGFLESANQQYHALGNNCSNAVGTGLKAAGLIKPSSPTISTPGSLSDYLEKMAESNQAQEVYLPQGASVPSSLNQFNPTLSHK